MTIPITGQPPVPGLDNPATFNTKALNLFTWITGSMLDQFNDIDAADFFGVQSSPTDAGAGKVLTVGAFGLGATTAAPLLANLNATGTPAGLYRYAAETTGTKPAGIAADGMVLVMRGVNATSFVQVLYSGNGASSWYRACVSGTFSAWVSGLTSGDISANANFAVDPTKLATRATIATAIAAAIAAGGPATYEGTNTTWTIAATPFSFTHGLGAVPRTVQVTFVCTTEDGGWSVGDELEAISQYGGSLRGVMATRNSTTVQVKVQATVWLMTKTTASYFVPNNTKWDLRVRAAL